MTMHIRRMFYTWLTQMVWLIEYEPTWFPEFGFGIGAIGWGIGCFLTDDLGGIAGWSWTLPVLSIVMGTVRCVVLLRLWYGPRVILTGLSALLVAWLWIGLAGHYGVVPMMGWMGGVFVIEMLTAAKFSIPCAREMRDDYLAWHHAR
jgi:hypothetical protein